MVVNGVPGSYFTLAFRRLSIAEDIQYHVEFSADLTNWNLPAIRLRVDDAADGTSFEVWRSRDPLSLDDRIFGRVRVVKP